MADVAQPDQPDAVQPEIMTPDIMQNEPVQTDSIEAIRGSVDKDDTKRSSSSDSLVFSGEVERKHRENSKNQLVLVVALVIGAVFSVPPIIYFMQRNEAQPTDTETDIKPTYTDAYTKPTVTKPTDTKPTVTKPTDTKPTYTDAVTKPTDTKPTYTDADTKPTDTETNTKPTDTKPTVTDTDTKPAVTYTDTKPTVPVHWQSELDKLKSNCRNVSRSFDPCKNCPGQGEVFTTRISMVNPEWVRDILEKFPNKRFVSTWQLRVYLTGEGEIDLKAGFAVLTLLRDEHNKTHGQLVELTSRTKDDGRLICLYTYETANAADIAGDIRKHVKIIDSSNQRNVVFAHPITLETIGDVDVHVKLKITASSNSLEFHFEVVRPPEGKGNPYKWSTPFIANPFGFEAFHMYAYSTLMKEAGPTFVSDVSCT